MSYVQKCSLIKKKWWNIFLLFMWGFKPFNKYVHQPTYQKMFINQSDMGDLSKMQTVNTLFN